MGKGTAVMTDEEIDTLVRTALERAKAPEQICKFPVDMRGCAFRFSRRPKDADDVQRPIVGTVRGFEFDPSGILMIHVDVRTFRGIPFTSIDFNLETNVWSMNFGSERTKIPGQFTFLFRG